MSLSPAGKSSDYKGYFTAKQSETAQNAAKTGSVSAPKLYSSISTMGLGGTVSGTTGTGAADFNYFSQQAGGAVKPTWSDGEGQQTFQYDSPNGYHFDGIGTAAPDGTIDRNNPYAVHAVIDEEKGYGAALVSNGKPGGYSFNSKMTAEDDEKNLGKMSPTEFYEKSKSAIEQGKDPVKDAGLFTADNAAGFLKNLTGEDGKPTEFSQTLAKMLGLDLTQEKQNVPPSPSNPVKTAATDNRSRPQPVKTEVNPGRVTTPPISTALPAPVTTPLTTVNQPDNTTVSAPVTTPAQPIVVAPVKTATDSPAVKEAKFLAAQAAKKPVAPYLQGMAPTPPLTDANFLDAKTGEYHPNAGMEFAKDSKSDGGKITDFSKVTKPLEITLSNRNLPQGQMEFKGMPNGDFVFGAADGPPASRMVGTGLRPGSKVYDDANHQTHEFNGTGWQRTPYPPGIQERGFGPNWQPIPAAQPAPGSLTGPNPVAATAAKPVSFEQTPYFKANPAKQEGLREVALNGARRVNSPGLDDQYGGRHQLGYLYRTINGNLPPGTAPQPISVSRDDGTRVTISGVSSNPDLLHLQASRPGTTPQNYTYRFVPGQRGNHPNEQLPITDMTP